MTQPQPVLSRITTPNDAGFSSAITFVSLAEQARERLTTIDLGQCGYPGPRLRSSQKSRTGTETSCWQQPLGSLLPSRRWRRHEPRVGGANRDLLILRLAALLTPRHRTSGSRLERHCAR